MLHYFFVEKDKEEGFFLALVWVENYRLWSYWGNFFEKKREGLEVNFSLLLDNYETIYFRKKGEEFMKSISKNW